MTNLSTKLKEIEARANEYDPISEGYGDRTFLLALLGKMRERLDVMNKILGFIEQNDYPGGNFAKIAKDQIRVDAIAAEQCEKLTNS